MNYSKKVLESLYFIVDGLNNINRYLCDMGEFYARKEKNK